MKTYNQFNESIRDKMTGKSKEELLDSIKDLTNDRKFDLGCKNGVTWLVKDLLDKGVDPTKWWGSGVYFAVLHGYIDIIKLIFESLKFKDNIKATEIDWLLNLAYNHNYKNIMKLILDNTTTKIKFDKRTYKYWSDKVRDMRVNESIRDKMLPKSEEEVNDIIKSWTPKEKFLKGLKFKIPAAIKQAREEMIPFEDVKVGDYLTISTYPGERVGFLKKILEKYTFNSLKEVEEYVKKYSNRLIRTDTLTYAFNNGKSQNAVRVNMGVDLLFLYGEDTGVFPYTEKDLKSINESIRDKMTGKSEEEILKGLENLTLWEQLLKGVEWNIDWIIKYAMSKGALDEISDHDKQYLLYNIIKKGNVEITYTLITSGIKIEDYDEALKIACNSGHLDMVKFMLNRCPDNYRNFSEVIKVVRSIRNIMVGDVDKERYNNIIELLKEYIRE